MCKWNLKKLAEALNPLLPLDTSLEILNTQYDDIYEEYYMNRMRNKLGLQSIMPTDAALITDLFETMASTQADFTDTFVAFTNYYQSLSTIDSNNNDKNNNNNNDKNSNESTFKNELLENIITRCANPNELASMMRRKMKIYKLGMHPTQIEEIWNLIMTKPTEASEMFGGAPIEALKEEIGAEKRKLDKMIQAATEIKRLETVSIKEKVDKDRNIWNIWLSKYYSRLSNEDTKDTNNMSKVVENMRQVNPTFVLRNWIAQDAIEAAEGGDFSKVLCSI